MKILKCVVLATILLPLCASESIATPVHLSLAEVIKIGLTTSPHAAEIDATLAKRLAEAFSTEVLANPSLQVEVEVPTEKSPGGGIEQENITIVLSQPIRSSDGGSRRKLSEAIRDLGSATKVIELNEYVQTVVTRYTGSWSAQAREQVYRKAHDRARGVLRDVEVASKGGLIAEGDLHLFSAEAQALKAEALAAHTEFDKARAEMHLLGISMPEEVLLEKPESVLKLSPSELEERVRDETLPIQERYKAYLRVASQQQHVAKLERWPAITPQLGVGRHDDGTNQVLLGVSVPLPLFNSNQGSALEAAGVAEAATRAASPSTTENLGLFVRSMGHALRSLEEQIMVYTDRVIPGRQKAVDAYTVQFRAGAGTTFQIWQAQRELNTAYLRQLELQTTSVLLKAQLATVTGQFTP